MLFKTMRLPISILLSVCLLGLIACNGKEKSPPPETPSPAVAESPSPQPSPKPAAGKTIKVPVLIKESRYHGTDKLDEYYSYEYDAALKVLLSKTLHDSQRSAPQGKSVYEYDAKGLLIRETVYGPENVLKYRIDSTYGPDGLKLQETRRDPRNVVVLTSRFAYDEAGRRTSWKIFMGEDELVGETQYRYEEGLLKRITLRARENEYRGMIQIEHDKKGREISRTNITARGTTESYEDYTYEGDRLAQERKTGVTGKLLLTILYDYDKAGSLIKKTVKNDKGKVKEYTVYEYAYREEEAPAE
jgi:hypothetical protein